MLEEFILYIIPFLKVYVIGIPITAFIIGILGVEDDGLWIMMIRIAIWPITVAYWIGSMLHRFFKSI